MQSVLNLFSPFEFSEAENQQRANVLRRVILISLAGSLVFGITSYLLQWGGVIPIASVVYALLALGCLWLIRKGWLDLPGILLPLVLLALVTFQTIRNHGPHDEAILIYPLVITFAWLLLSRRMAQIFLVLSLISAFLVIYLEVNGFITPHVEGSSEYLDIITFAMVLGSVAFLADSVMESLRGAIQHLQMNEHDLRQQAKALAQREAEIRMFIEEAPTGISIMDVQRRIELVNSRLCEMLGYTEQEMLGRDGAEFISPEELARLPLIPGEELVQGKSIREERLLTRKDGTTIWVLGSVRRLPDQRLQYTVQDISEQKQMEQSLRKSEEHYRTFIALSSEAIWRVDFNPPIPTDLPETEIIQRVLQTGMVVECNDAYANLYGYANSKAATGILLKSLLGEEPAKEDLDVLTEFVKSKFRLDNMETFSDDDGRPRYFVSNIIGIMDAGKLVTAWGTIQNVTEQRLAELEIQRKENLYRNAIEAAGAVPYYLEYGSPSRYTFMGEGIEVITGYTSQEMTPELYNSFVEEASLIGEAAQYELEEAVTRTKQGDIKYWATDNLIHTKTGSKQWITDSAVQVKDTTGKIVGSIGIIQNITERKRVLAEREGLIQTLEARNAELERFAYTLSHEMKTPIVTIRGYLGSLQNDITTRKFERIDNDVLRITNATDRIQQLMNELIELFRVGRVSNPFEDVAFRDIALAAMQQVEDLAKKRGAEINLQKKMPILHGDRTQLTEVLKILLENAVKFMGSQSQPQIEIGTRVGEANSTIFYVRDNGMGIESEYHEKIFGLFNKLDATSAGTGVGLTLVRRIIELHGGRIWVESEGLGKGSTFCFTLSEKK